jgi:hypothetical protein
MIQLSRWNCWLRMLKLIIQVIIRWWSKRHLKIKKRRMIFIVIFRISSGVLANIMKPKNRTKRIKMMMMEKMMMMMMMKMMMIMMIIIIIMMIIMIMIIKIRNKVNIIIIIKMSNKITIFKFKTNNLCSILSIKIKIYKNSIFNLF